MKFRNMAKITWTINLIPKRIKQFFKHKWDYLVLMYRSFFYNEFTNWNSCLDTVLEPMMWFVDHFARYLGPIMVTFVIVMITFVVVVFYTCLFPRLYFISNTLVTVSHLIFGHWLLMNIVFHYLMCVFRKAGRPPSSNVENSVSICKKCISPKPPRTHHCSICNSCTLKMDHHCPWMNNCIGFYNHHHFFLLLFYMWLGNTYTSYVGYDLYIQHFFGNSINDLINVGPIDIDPEAPYYTLLQELIFPKFFYPLNGLRDQIPVTPAYTLNEEINPIEVSVYKDSYTAESIIRYKDEIFHNLVVYQFLVCTGVSIAIGLLTLWHFRLISHGETSIEQCLNGKQRKRLKKKGRVFKNPYNLGFVANWKEFFGVTRKKSFLRLVLFPSFHVAPGRGLYWKTSTYQLEDENSLQLL